MNPTIEAINEIVSNNYPKLLKICVSKLPKKYNLQDSDDIFHDAYCSFLRFPGVTNGDIKPENITIPYLISSFYLIMKRTYINNWVKSKRLKDYTDSQAHSMSRYHSPDLTPEFLDLISNFDEKETKYLRARIQGKSLRQIVRDGIVKDWVEYDVYDSIVREKLSKFYLIGV